MTRKFVLNSDIIRNVKKQSNPSIMKLGNSADFGKSPVPITPVPQKQSSSTGGESASKNWGIR